MANSDIQQMLGIISQKTNTRKRKHRQDFAINKHLYDKYGTSGSAHWDAGRQHRDKLHEEAHKRNSEAQKKSPSHDTKQAGRHLISNPQLTPGYQPGTLRGIIRPVGSFEMPGDNGDFGPRDHPVTGRYSYHTGLDMSESAGTNVYAAASGIVDDAFRNNIYGNEVVLFHGINKKTGVKYDTMYGHMQTLLVHPGQKVAQGDLIGYVGETGLATGNHLHFETWENKKPVNPLKYLTEYDKDDLKKRVAPTPNVEAVHGKDNHKLEAFLNAIAEQESNSNYQAVGKPTKYGTAFGKYQILDSNIRGPEGWDKEMLGRNVSIEEYLHTPALQERIARGKLTQYFDSYGPQGAAKAWYGGPGVANVDSNRSQYGGPSINSYANSVLNRMRKYM